MDKNKNIVFDKFKELLSSRYIAVQFSHDAL